MSLRLMILCLATWPCFASISGIAVDPAGNVYFTDWNKNKIWRIDASGAVALMSEHHTHHLHFDRQGVLYGEHANPEGSIVSLWKMPAPRQFEDVIPAAHRDRHPVFQGGAFVLDNDGAIVTVMSCQLWRIANGQAVRLAGVDCQNSEWTHAELRFGHIHGSLALAPERSFYFTDARTVRKVTRDGTTTTLDGAPVQLFAGPLPGEMRFDRALGLDVDSDGAIYVADSDRGVFRIRPGGAAERVYRAEPAWSPTGLAVRGGTVYIVENRPDYLKPFAGIIGSPRVRKIQADGAAITLWTVRNQPLRIALAICALGAVVALVLMRKSFRLS